MPQNSFGTKRTLRWDCRQLLFQVKNELWISTFKQKWEVIKVLGGKKYIQYILYIYKFQQLNKLHLLVKIVWYDKKLDNNF